MKSPACIPLCSAIALLLWGCVATPSLDLGQPGKSFSYATGYPSFDLEAVPGPGGIRVFLSVPCLSLTFLRVGDEFLARTQISVRLYDPEPRTLTADIAWPESTRAATYEMTRSGDPVPITRIVPAFSGMHLLVVTLEDIATGRSESRSQLVAVHDPSDTRPSLGRIILESTGKNGAPFPVVPFHIPAGTPGLRVLASLYGVAGERRADISIALERFRIDQQAAASPAFYPFAEGMGEPRKILFDAADTLWTINGVLRGTGVDTTIACSLDSLAPGLYRISIAARVSSAHAGADTTVAASRIVSVKPAGFPKPVTLQQLIESMVYILRPPEVRQLLRARTAAGAHALFDSLWLSFCPNSSDASTLIRRYYTRVEEANRQFTDLKEGWKTDRGMVYIVLGPPSEIMNNLDRQTWYYDLPGSMGTRTFLFKRMIIGEGETSVMTFVLFRDALYEQVWQSFLARWRRCEGY